MSDITNEEQKAIEREHSAARRMQSGLATLQHYNPRMFEPKHARVGIDTALVEIGALGELLIKRDVITRLEYLNAMADGMEREVTRLEAELSNLTNANVTLGECGLE